MAARGPDQKARRLIAATVIAALLVNYPVLALVEAAAQATDVPIVPLWLVAVWAGLIGVVARLAAPAVGTDAADATSARTEH